MQPGGIIALGPYDGLCVGTHGDRVRLEQELIRFDLIESAVATSHRGSQLR
jgi:hypothetical protein